MKTRYAKRFQRALRMESLEDRVTLAGDVTAALSAAGDLTIRGDVHENHIAIIDAGAGQVIVQGSNNTTITANGQTSAQAVFNVSSSGLRNVRVEMSNGLTAEGDVRGKFGADVVALTGVKVAGNLSVKGGHAGVVTMAGANVKGSTTVNFGAGVSSGNGAAAIGSKISLGVAASNNLGASVAINTGGSNDDVNVAANVIGRNLSLKAGAGDDSISLGVGGSLKVGGKLSVDAGTGNNTVAAANADVSGKASFTARGGVDKVVLGSAQASVATTFRNSVAVKLGDGAHNALLVQGNLNSVSATSASASTTFDKHLTVSGGAGVDKIGFNGAAVKGNLKVSSAAAHDAVLAANFAVLGKASLSTGAGDDIVALSAVQGGLGTSVNGASSVSLGAGADRLSINGANLRGSVKVSGGAGADTVAVSNASFGGKVSVSGGGGLNSLLVDAATVQLAANTTLKAKSTAQLDGAALTLALAQSASAVQTAAVDTAFQGLFA